ncbi:hypothetical protein J4E89_007686 [Alternaria sp. Ai002NY15]|nr:hypothetical protein J4E89_007686 [Alternaria sp. Ai002NY15]
MSENSDTPPRRAPFTRVDWISLKTRRTRSDDPRLTVPRVGYPQHGRKDYKFWKSWGDTQITQAPRYSEELFCEGFNLTALEFYIVRMRLMSLLHRDSLYLSKRKVENKVDLDIEYEYREVEDKIAKHSLLCSPAVGALWKGKMIAEFISKTADFMRTKATALTDADGAPIPGEYEFRPNHIRLRPTWKWGPKVMTLKHANKDHTPISKLHIMIRTYPLEKNDDGSVIRVETILNRSGGRPKLEDADYATFRKKTLQIFTYAKGKEHRFSAAYMNPYMGNDMLLIEDDESLRVALSIMRVRGRTTMPFWFIEPNDDEGADDDSDASSIASWKTEGYYTDEGRERQFRHAARTLGRPASPEM